MIADIIYQNTQYRFRVALVSNPKRYGTHESGLMDYELTCISESFPDKLACKRFDYYDFKKYWREGIIKVTI
jgi:hypothetical protein